MRVRRARPDEAGVLTDLARRSKAHWGYDGDFMRDAEEDLTVRGRDTETGLMFVLEDADGSPLGFHGLRTVGRDMEMTWLFVEPGRLRQGLGRMLWDHAARVEHGALGIRLVSDPHAAGFYRRMGAVEVGMRPSPLRANRPLPAFHYPLSPAALGSDRAATSPASPTAVTVRALKLGGRPHYEWAATLIERNPAFGVCKIAPGTLLVHHTRGQTFALDHWSVQFFPFQEWFTLMVDIAAGQVRQYYCNISQPPRLDGSTLSFVDLDLDLIRAPGTDWRLVDEDDLESHRVRFAYPDTLVKRVRREAASLRSRFEQGGFPLDGTLGPYVAAVLEESRCAAGGRESSAAPGR